MIQKWLSSRPETGDLISNGATAEFYDWDQSPESVKLRPDAYHGNDIPRGEYHKRRGLWMVADPRNQGGFMYINDSEFIKYADRE